VPLPFDLPSLSRGYAELGPEARRVGADVARGAAQALSGLLGAPVSLTGRPVPAANAARPATARLALELAALPGLGALEVEPSLIVRLVDRLAGGPGEAPPTAALTPIETTAFELLALVALEGALRTAPVEAALAPRVVRGAQASPGALSVELELDAGGIRGRGRLVLPPAAIRALRGPTDPGAAPIRLPASVRSGAAALAPQELAALAPGDAVVLEPPPAAGGDALVLPGGRRIPGRLGEDGTFQVTEEAMTDRMNDLPVVLEVELGRVELTLGELARLEPGAAVPLGLDRRGIVTLRAGERAVARGELIDVDGAVGVRILSVEVGP
jgi:type III secretion system YscQ/HrcQ family protein